MVNLSGPCGKTFTAQTASKRMSLAFRNKVHLILRGGFRSKNRFMSLEAASWEHTPTILIQSSK